MCQILVSDMSLYIEGERERERVLGRFRGHSVQLPTVEVNGDLESKGLAFW